MPTVKKIDKDTYTGKKRGRPAGSKNRPKVAEVSEFEPEKLYTYKASDGCQLESGLKSKTLRFTCKHNKPMDLQK